MTERDTRESFWKVVEKCLQQFHGFQQEIAKEKCRTLRGRLGKELPEENLDPEIVYHAEPFYVACDIARKQLNLRRNREEYDKILGQSFKEEALESFVESSRLLWRQVRITPKRRKSNKGRSDQGKFGASGATS
ncbi:MAG: hypothetical protein HY618_03850 [Candidatus Tectomicrobia bacterium]|uniref:Uncharacterized protein n=1 Tax=Tectimicrobiota bacterium TaxID=2528274 RepID=A0A933E7M2_UNCTE|nr:hypothetical protein [Candidatus Tectomicrobia bacterium]MBI4251572.1 hypothetical protein [Candidatus Tectomicrobia bacterium]